MAKYKKRKLNMEDIVICKNYLVWQKLALFLLFPNSKSFSNCCCVISGTSKYSVFRVFRQSKYSDNPGLAQLTYFIHNSNISSGKIYWRILQLIFLANADTTDTNRNRLQQLMIHTDITDTFWNHWYLLTHTDNTVTYTTNSFLAY